MKPLFLLLCCASVRAWAAWNVATEFRVVRLPISSGLEIVELFSEERTTREATAMVERMLGDGRAVLVAELFGTVADGDQLLAEDVTEHRYPTEYESPNPRLAPSRASGLAIPAAPTVMEVKNIGTTLKSSPAVWAGGAVIQASIATQRVSHPGNFRYEYGIRADGIKYVIEQPKFVTKNTRTIIVARSGIPTLVGCYLDHEKPEQLELHIVTLTASGTAEPKVEAEPVGSTGMARVELRRYRLPVADGVRARIAIERGDIAADEILRKLAAEGKATLAECVSLPTYPWRQSLHENVLEVRYPTEFDARGGGPPTLAVDKRAAAFWALPPSVNRDNWRHFLGPHRTVVTPDYIPLPPQQMFEVMNVGSVFEIEIDPYYATESAALLNVNDKQIENNGFIRRLDVADHQGERLYDYQPVFTERRTMTNRALPIGKWVLETFHRRTAPNDDVEITIARLKTNRFTLKTP